MLLEKAPLSPSVVLDFLDGQTGIRYDYIYLTDFRLQEEQGNHQVATISGNYVVPWIKKSGAKAAYTYPPATLLAKGKKMFVRYGARPNLDLFPCEILSAKVNSTSRLSTKVDLVRVTYTLVPASWPMQVGAANKVWSTGVTRSYLARTMAIKYGMLPIVDNHPQVLPYVAQKGETDFAFLRRMAKEIGYLFFVDGTTLHFRNPLVSFNAASSSTVTLSMDKRAGLRDSLLDFHSVDNLDPGSTAVRKVYGLNPHTSALIEARNQYLDFTAFDQEAPNGFREPTTTMQLETDKAITNYSQAAEYARFNALVNIKWIRANVRGLGDTRIKPGGLVNLTGDAMIDNSKGFWVADKVVHHVLPSQQTPTLSQYYVEAEISRDQVYDTNFVPSSTWTSVKSTPVLVGNKWRAQNLSTESS